MTTLSPGETATGPTRFDGRWITTLDCEPFMEMPANHRVAPTEIRLGKVDISRGREGFARFDGQFGPRGYESIDRFGKRGCTLNMMRADS